MDDEPGIRKWLEDIFWKTEVLRSRLLSLSYWLVAILCGIVLTIVAKNYLGLQGGFLSGERNYSIYYQWERFCSQPGNDCWNSFAVFGSNAGAYFKPKTAIGGYGYKRRGRGHALRPFRNQGHVSANSQGWLRRVMAQNTVPEAVLKQTKNLRLREALLLGSSLEGGWNPPFPVGDQGTSFGPYQMHEGGDLTAFGLTPAQAENARIATKYMLPVYASAVNQISDNEWQNNPEQAAEQAAFIAEQPAQDYYATDGSATIDQNWQNTQDVLSGKKSQSGKPSGGKNVNATFTSASIPGWLQPLLSIVVPGLAGADFSNPFTTKAIGAGIKADLERIGLVALGGILVIVGLVIFAIPAAKKAAGTAVSANRGISAARNIGGAGQADIARRQAIADRSLALGEQKIALQRQREARLARTR